MSIVVLYTHMTILLRFIMYCEWVTTTPLVPNASMKRARGWDFVTPACLIMIWTPCTPVAAYDHTYDHTIIRMIGGIIRPRMIIRNFRYKSNCGNGSKFWQELWPQDHLIVGSSPADRHPTTDLFLDSIIRMIIYHTYDHKLVMYPNSLYLYINRFATRNRSDIW